MAVNKFYITDTVIKFSAPGGVQDANDWVSKIRNVIWVESRRVEEFEVRHRHRLCVCVYI